MFEDWKQAWRQAVENFHREAGGGSTGAPPRVRAMERELTSASGALGKLEDEIRRTRRAVEREREEEQKCLRRESLARNVADEETVRIAAEFAQRHAERASVLDRKIAVLEDERALLSRDVAAMRSTLAELAPADASPGVSAGEQPRTPRDEAGDREFSRLERDVRERAVDERLEELKRKMNR